jgi:uncharacterized membrane protein HdeD (DUF308 family)
MTMGSLVRDWWMMALRGVLAVVFGLAVLMWPDLTLSVIVVMFGVYALADGATAIAAGVHASARLLDAWPVLLQGVAGVMLGLVALLWPSMPRNLLYVVAAWGVITGVLELVVAGGLSRTRPARWLLLTGGASSVFLALLIVALPYAGTDPGARIIAAYAQVFGVVLLLAAVDFPRRHEEDALSRQP